MFSCEFYEICKNIFSYRTYLVAVSVGIFSKTNFRKSLSEQNICFFYFLISYIPNVHFFNWEYTFVFIIILIWWIKKIGPLKQTNRKGF